MEKTLSAKVSEFWEGHKGQIQIIGAFFASIFITFPGWINAVTGKPFSEWLKEHGMNMPFVTYLFWGFGIAVSVFIFCHERTLIKQSGYKFSALPWIYVVGFTVLMLFKGFYNPSNHAPTTTFSTNTVNLIATNFVMVTNFVDAPKNLKISDVDAKQESKYSGGSNYDFGKMAVAGRDAFQSGDYAYCIIFLSQCDANDPNGSWQVNRLYLAAATLAQNPTTIGYKKFQSDIAGFVEIVRNDLKKQNGEWVLFGNPANGGDCGFSLIYWTIGQIEQRMTASEVANMEAFINQIKAIQKATKN